ncbi:MAG: hypothetical protein J6Y20_11505 [Lachnospiraceae bacterium]|nr:hypothetical protein [Lachnospiraceae bacterium]
MKKLTVLIDMDDTIENLGETWVQCLNERHGTNVQRSDVTDWDVSKAFPTLTRHEVYAPLFDKRMWKRVQPLPGAVEYVKKLIEDGHKVLIVTASHQNTVGIKLNHVLFKYFPFFTYKDVIVTTQKQLISGDILIDDAPHNLEGGKYHGILVSAPHNRSYDAEKHGFVRADNWETIYKAVCDYANEGKEREQD